MINNKRVSLIFTVLATLLSDAMCALVAYRYCDMLYGIEYRGYSAPASTAFLIAIPFLVGIVICVIIAYNASKRTRRT